MFYFKEFFLRLFYLFFSFFLTFAICFIYKDTILFLFSFFLISEANKLNIGFDHFIYTHPLELVTIFILLCIILSFFTALPFLFWQLLDFLKTGLYIKELFIIKCLIIFFLFFIYFLNFISLIILFPKIWFFFESFNTMALKNSLLSNSIFFELKLQDYFSFLFDFFFNINLIIFLVLFLLFFVHYIGLIFLIRWKKLFIFLNIVFATLLSPPDVYSQLIIFVFLNIFLELFLVFYIIYLKLKKHLFNRVAC